VVIDSIKMCYYHRVGDAVHRAVVDVKPQFAAAGPIAGSILLRIKDKNSLFESGSSKKSRLTGLCDVWGWVTTYRAAAVAAPISNRRHPIKSHIQNEDRNVNPANG
jgi:hypothetical protein